MSQSTNASTSAGRSLVRLAVPALGVLAAEPLYVLVDTAVVGHLGAVPLAGLALGGLLLSLVSTQLVFLAYGTTARTARLHGAGRRTEAVAEGVQATWLGALIGLVLLGVGQALAGPIARGLAGPGPIADGAVEWLRIALFGVPLILITLAGNGWLRGVQDTRRPLRYVVAGNGLSAVLCPILVHVVHMGLAGSAVANVAAQVTVAALFLRTLLSEGISLRPQWRSMRAQLGMGRDLVLRSLAFQACFVSAASVAARTSAAAVAAHQVVLQLWTLLALVLDSLAIAAQSLVGASLGAGDATGARTLARKVSGYGLAFGIGTGALFAALAGVLPMAFTTDAAVLAQVPHAWWFFVGLQPVAGVVFAVDGVLLGAGDAAYLRTVTLLAAVVGFLPLVWLSLALHWGLTGIWTGLAAFMVVRLAAALARLATGRWAVPGSTVPACGHQAGCPAVPPTPRPVVPPGLVIADKPAGMTSHDVVARVRRIFGTRKVGHAGTLDPMATGVLVLGLERATKLLGHLALERKVYLATIRLGASTTTDDAEGEILSEVDGSAVPEAEILAGVAVLSGPIDQVPSAVSAVKVAGKRAYQRVRDGEQVELAARPVVVHRFDVLALRREPQATELDVLVDCSSGTYVRALARDLGAGLGVGGHLTALRRTQVGPFGLRTARTLDELTESPELSMDLDTSVATAFPRRDVDLREATALAHGQRLSAAGLPGTYGVFDPDGHVIALARDEGSGLGGHANALVVLSPAG